MEHVSRAAITKLVIAKAKADCMINFKTFLISIKSVTLDLITFALLYSNREVKIKVETTDAHAGPSNPIILYETIHSKELIIRTQRDIVINFLVFPLALKTSDMDANCIM